MKKKHFTCNLNVMHEEVVARVRKTMPDDDRFYDLANLYKIFADGTRLKILWALSQEKMCVCDIAALIGTTNSAVSHQLKALRMAKFVKYERQGKIIYYSLADDHVNIIFEQGFDHVKGDHVHQ